MVRVCGRPSNIVQETGSFDIDAKHWISFPNTKALFPWSGIIPSNRKHEPIPNPSGPKFVSVSSFFAGIKTEALQRGFTLILTLVTFLGSAPPAYTTKGEYPNPCLMALTYFPLQRQPLFRKGNKRLE